MSLFASRQAGRPSPLYFAAIAALLAVCASCGGRGSEEIAYSTLKQHIAKGEVREVNLSASEIQAVPTEQAQAAGAPPRWVATPVPSDNLVPLLEAKGITYGGLKEEASRVTMGVGFLTGLLVIAVIFMAYRRTNPVRSMTSLTRGRLRARDKQRARTKTSFDSVAGVDEAKEELEEIVKFLRDPAKFSQLGARVPKGALLVGPPGTGKTLLARAVAGEAGVPFFSASGSEFIEVFVGVGAQRVRKLFEQAKSKAPAIVFIDELDAIGKSRSSGSGGGSDERDQTLNQLLVEMDGFDSRDGIVVLAATNRSEILDSALLRPGRFDRQVLVDRPDGTGRHAILRVHARKVKLSDDVDLEYVAKRTPGFVGADLENVLNEAALLAARGEKLAVGMPELHAAIDRVVVGLERKNRLTNVKERRIVAFHESGHAIVAELAASAEPVHKVSIVPRGLAALGYMQQTPEDRNLLQEDELMDRLAVLLGGRAAEQLAFGKLSTGASNDLERATALARRMICEFGMSTGMGPVTLQSGDGRGRRAGDGAAELSENATGRIEAEVQSLLTRAFDQAVNTLSVRRAVLDSMAEALLAQGSLDREEFLAILSCQLPASSSEPPASSSQH
jgi:cell division protease FtsH